MKGLHLRSLSGELLKVEPQHTQKPVNAIKNIDEKLGPWKQQMLEEYGEDFSFLKNYHQLPLEALKGFSFDELCKLEYSTVLMMRQSVGELFKTHARYEVVRKIQSSMWRWGYGNGVWNEVVDAYEHIRHFSFTRDPDFEIRLDYTTYWNEFGYSKYSRTFIDGIFAFLVYYKKEHVMTIGFSVMDKKRLLIQQIQSAKRSGNRYLYRLPKNRLEFVIGLFREQFPGYRLYVIDGGMLMEKTLADYRRALARAYERCVRYRANGEDRIWLIESERECEELEARIAHLEADKPRIVAFYANGGRFRFGSTQTVNRLLHRRVCVTRTKKECTTQSSLETPQ